MSLMQFRSSRACSAFFCACLVGAFSLNAPTPKSNVIANSSSCPTPVKQSRGGGDCFAREEKGKTCLAPTCNDQMRVLTQPLQTAKIATGKSLPQFPDIGVVELALRSFAHVW